MVTVVASVQNSNQAENRLLFSNKVEKKSRYFVGVFFIKRIIPLALSLLPDMR